MCGRDVAYVTCSGIPLTNILGPTIEPSLMRSRMAMSLFCIAPRSRTVVTPASRVRAAFLRARNTVTAGCSSNMLSSNGFTPDSGSQL